METQKYSVYNPSRESFLSAGVTVIDTTLEPLKVLKVMIEGLALNAETGLWLTPLKGIPKVPRLSPFDLVYLDGDSKVVQGAELLPGVDFPPFTGEAASALVLPFRTMSSSQTRPGDQLTLQVVEEIDSQLEPVSEAAIDERADSTAKSELEAPLVGLAPSRNEDISSQDIGELHWLGGVKTQELQDQDEARAVPSLNLAEEEHVSLADTEISTAASEVTTDKEFPATVPPRKIESSLAPHEQSAHKPLGIPRLRGKRQAESGTHEEDSLKATRMKLAEEIERQRKQSPPVSAAAPIAQRIETSVKQPVKGGAAGPPKRSERMKLRQAAAKRPVLTEKAKTESDGSEEESVVTRALRWLYPDAVPLPNRRGALRCPMPELVAYHWTDGIPKSYQVGDISSTGIYLVTERRWPRGELVSLTLQRKGPPEESSERRVKLKAEAVRWGKEGIGLRFVMPTGMDLRLWDGPPKSGEVRGSEYVMQEVRMSSALSFVKRICPLVGEGVGQLFQEELSSYRSAGAVEIALKAEEFLAFEPDADRLLAHPALVLRILEVGSWADIDFIRRLWAGLLVTSCTLEGDDESNLPFVDTLSVLTPLHLRILTDAWARAIRLKLERGSIPKDSLYRSAEEITKITGISNLTKIHRAVTQLSDLGMLERPSALSFASDTERLKTTPTPLGMQMYARCNRYRGEI